MNKQTEMGLLKISTRSIHISRKVKVGDYVTIETDRGKKYLRKANGTSTVDGVVVVDKHDVIQTTLYLLEHDDKYLIEIDGYLITSFGNGWSRFGTTTTTGW